MLRNRRIQLFSYGIRQPATTNRGIDDQELVEEGYDTIQDWDKEYSDWFYS